MRQKPVRKETRSLAWQACQRAGVGGLGRLVLKGQMLHLKWALKGEVGRTWERKPLLPRSVQRPTVPHSAEQTLSKPTLDFGPGRGSMQKRHREKAACVCE